MDGYLVDHVRVAQARQALRGANGKPLTQRLAAERLDVHPVTLNRIENGKARVSLELLERMATLYGCTREHLLGASEQVDPIAAARNQVADALEKIGGGFEELADVVEVLQAQAVAAKRQVVAA